MTLTEKIEALKELAYEMTSDQDFGESCAATMCIDEDELHEMQGFILELLGE